MYQHNLASTAGHAIESTKDLNTFLHTTQDQTRHFRQLNDLIPSPGMTATTHRGEPVSQNLLTLPGNNSSAVSYWRMQVPNDGVPVHHETSEELPGSDHSNQLNPTDQDSGDYSDDEDGSSTVYASRAGPDQTSHSFNRVATRHETYHLNTNPDESQLSNQEETRLVASEESSDLAHPYGNIPQSTQRDVEDNRRHALAEGIGFNTPSTPQTLPSSTPHYSHANQLNVEPHSPTNATSPNQYAHNQNSTTNYSQSRLSSISSYFNSARKFLGSNVRPTQTDSLDLNEEDTPPTSPLRNPSDDDDQLNHQNKKSTHALQSQIALEALEMTCSNDELPVSQQHSHHHDDSPYHSQETSALFDADLTPIARSKPSLFSFNKTPSFINFNQCEPPNQSQPTCSKRSVTLPSKVSQQPPGPSLPSTSFPPSDSPSFESQSPSQPLPPSDISPIQRPISVHAPWKSFQVKTPSKLQISYIPVSPSDTTLSEQTGNLSPGFLNQPSFASQILDHSPSKDQKPPPSGLEAYSQSPIGLPAPMATPQHIRRKKEFEKTFLQSPIITRDAYGHGGSSTPGEARIFHQSQQTNSILHAMNGQSWTHIQDQSLPPLTPNQSFGLEFSSPIGIKDWSIHHSPLPPPPTEHHGHSNSYDVDTVLCEPGDVTAEMNRAEQTSTTAQNLPTVDAKPNELTDESRCLPKKTRAIEDGSLFGPRASQIAPLPRFSPFRVPEPRSIPSDHHDPVSTISNREESPLTTRTKKRHMGAGKVHVLSQSILRPRTSQPQHDSACVQSSKPSQHDNVLSGYVESQSPNRLTFHPSRVLDPNLETTKSPSSVNRFKPPLSTMADDSVYLTPDTSLMAEHREQLVDIDANAQTLAFRNQSNQAFENDAILAGMARSQDDVSFAWEANLLSRCRALASLVLFSVPHCITNTHTDRRSEYLVMLI
jgi:hypothetical protein